MCAITKTTGRIKVAEQHERASRLKSQTCQWKSRGVERVEKLYGIYVRVVTVDFIYSHAYGLLSREPVEDGVIEMINSIILCREDGAFKEELV